MAEADHSKVWTPDHVFRSHVGDSIMWFKHPRQATARTRLMVEAKRKRGEPVGNHYPRISQGEKGE